jgi:hypothetical protein
MNKNLLNLSREMNAIKIQEINLIKSYTHHAFEYFQLLR